MTSSIARRHAPTQRTAPSFDIRDAAQRFGRSTPAASPDPEATFNALNHSRQAVIFLRERGVSPQAIANPEMPRVASIAFTGGGFFDFADEIETDQPLARAMIFLARDQSGEPADLVAWVPNGNHLARWLGRTCLLGADKIFCPRLLDEGGLPVYRSPEGWMLNQRDGVVIVNQDGAVAALMECGPLIGEDEAHGLELDCLVNQNRVTIYARSAA
jgi:hypothetical protein